MFISSNVKNWVISNHNRLDTGNTQLAEGQGAMTQPAAGTQNGAVGYLVSYVVGVRPSSSPVFKSYWAVECCKQLS